MTEQHFKQLSIRRRTKSLFNISRSKFTEAEQIYADALQRMENIREKLDYPLLHHLQTPEEFEHSEWILPCE